MNTVCRDIFRAIHEGKWLKIEYKNRDGNNTRYWIGIRDITVQRRMLTVDGLHLGSFMLQELHIYIDSILTSEIIEGTYCPVNKSLVKDIAYSPEKYKTIFDNVANLRILNYLELCNRLDTTPYHKDFALIEHLDNNSFSRDGYTLSDDQFETIVKHFNTGGNGKAEKTHVGKDGSLHIRKLAMNELSLYTPRGLYILAYRVLNLDIKNRCLRPAEETTVCQEFLIDGSTKESVRKYLDAEDYGLLSDFDRNRERIKDCISRRSDSVKVDDMPYILGIGMDIPLDLHSEYSSIIQMYEEGNASIPIRAFFGDLLKRPVRTKSYPIALINDKINLDQLLAIHNGMKYPLAYIQGPPGTGKTNTIINTVVTAFFNDKTVLFSSYNNHPLDSVVEKLTSLEYNGNTIPFPILRLGNKEKIAEAIEYIKVLYDRVRNINIYSSVLDRRRDDRKERAKELSALLKTYEEILDLREREETLHRLIEYQNKCAAASVLLPFTSDLNSRQLQQVRDEIGKKGIIEEKDAVELLDRNESEFLQYMYYTSAGYIKRLGEEKYRELRSILEMEDGSKRSKAFADYISKQANLEKLLRVFPIIVTTCISAHRLGSPKPLFDMVIMDEASQCNTAVSLVPIIRGNNLMLVGDPQQLSPVILLDEKTNEQLKKKYQITEAYDYRQNSIYKTFLACDSVSDEVLLHNHYRCHERIINFNNRKYYNSKLSIRSHSNEQQPLVFCDIHSSGSSIKNTSPEEASQIVRYVAANKDKKIGIITPFVNQRELIEEKLKLSGLGTVSCGTVHSFQGDEKDIILFSTAVGDNTQAGTYEWLKNNRELINVATSRARDKLIILADYRNLERLHTEGSDDLYELVRYVRSNGDSVVSEIKANSRALGVKPFSTQTEEAFLQTLTHALGNIWLGQNRYTIHKEVPVAQVFQDNTSFSDLFYTGRFDFVVYERTGRKEIPVLVIELDGKEHFDDDIVKKRDAKKNAICKEHNLELIRVENSYARRYNYVKSILSSYFKYLH